MTEPNQSIDAARRRSMLPLAVLAVLFVLVPFLVWHQTWFGRPLSDSQVSEYLGDDDHPRRIQHALSHISDRIVARDATVEEWYPRIIALARHPRAKIRTTVAWVMGQDNSSQAFRQALRSLLNDKELMVRRNAALSLVRFADASGRDELRAMLQPHTIRSTGRGTVLIQVRNGQDVGTGILLARISPGDGSEIEIRSPFGGQIERVVARDGAPVDAGDPIVSVRPAKEQVWEALRALYLVGEAEDLEEVDLLGRSAAYPSDRIRRQAVLTAQAIRTRSERGPIR